MKRCNNQIFISLQGLHKDKSLYNSNNCYRIVKIYVGSRHANCEVKTFSISGRIKLLFSNKKVSEVKIKNSSERTNRREFAKKKF